MRIRDKSLEYLQPHAAAFTWLVISLFGFMGCADREGKAPEQVVVYTSLDRPHSAPIFDLFQKETGIEVKAVFDTEASKTVGLFHRLLAERGRPQADVFWNSEVTRTLRLKEEGLLRAYESPAAATIPPNFKDAEGFWAGFGLRGRVVLGNTGLVTDLPRSFQDLSASRWKGRAAIANPLFGTTNTHFASLYLRTGEDGLVAFCKDLVSNEVAIMTGNAQTRDAVAAGEVSVCMTDTDDARSAIENGRPVEMAYADFAEEGSGALLIPNTVSIIADGPNPGNAERFVDFLLSEKVEETLAQSATAQIPVRDSVPRPEHVPQLSDLTVADVDYAAISKEEVLERVAEIVKEHLLK